MKEKKVRLINETDIDVPSIDWEAVFVSAQKILEKKLSGITVVFISDEKSHALNSKYRGKDIATDVLSFEEDREILLAVSLIQKEAAEQKISTKNWMTRLFVHGILHLEGFKHDTDANHRNMNDLEEKILGKQN